MAFFAFVDSFPFVVCVLSFPELVCAVIFLCLLLFAFLAFVDSFPFVVCVLSFPDLVCAVVFLLSKIALATPGSSVQQNPTAQRGPKQRARPSCSHIGSRDTARPAMHRPAGWCHCDAPPGGLG